MEYKIGDTIVHRIYGIGTVVAIEQKHIAGVTQQYYVIDVELLKLWVPVIGANEGSLRLPIESVQFKKLFNILRRPGKQLPDNNFQRRNELRDRMKTRILVDLCQVIRDLKDRSRHHSLTQNDNSVLSHAEKNLLDEWVLSLGVDRSNAVQELEGLLDENLPEPENL